MSAEELDALVLDDLQYKCAWPSLLCNMHSSRVASLYMRHHCLGGGALRLTGWRPFCNAACLAPGLVIEAEHGRIRVCG